MRVDSARSKKNARACDVTSTLLQPRLRIGFVGQPMVRVSGRLNVRTALTVSFMTLKGRFVSHRRETVAMRVMYLSGAVRQFATHILPLMLFLRTREMSDPCRGSANPHRGAFGWGEKVIQLIPNADTRAIVRNDEPCNIFIGKWRRKSCFAVCSRANYTRVAAGRQAMADVSES